MEACLEFAAENKTLFAMTLIGMICCVAFLCYHATRSSSRLPLWKNTNKVKPPTDAKMEFINQLTALHSAPDFWEQAHNMLHAEQGRAAKRELLGPSVGNESIIGKTMVGFLVFPIA